MTDHIPPALWTPSETNLAEVWRVVEQPDPGTSSDARPEPSRSRWEIAAVAALAALVLAIVGVGLYVGMGALQDAATAAHIESGAADLYWIGVDGLIVVAIIAAMVLRHDKAARTYCLVVIGVFTLASGLLQYLHGLGWFDPVQLAKPDGGLPWGVVLVIAFLVIGMIFCATHLFVHSLRRLFPDASGAPAHQDEQAPEAPADEGETPAPPSAPEVVYQPAPPDPEEIARLIYNLGLDLDIKISRDRLAKACGISSRAAGRVRADVDADREEAAAQDATPRFRPRDLKTAIDTSNAIKSSANGTRPHTGPDLADATTGGA